MYVIKGRHNCIQCDELKKVEGLEAIRQCIPIESQNKKVWGEASTASTRLYFILHRLLHLFFSTFFLLSKIIITIITS